MKLEAAQLQQVYARFPSLKANADRSALAAAAEKVLGTEPAKALLLALADEDTYLSARASAPALVSSSPEQQLRSEPALSAEPAQGERRPTAGANVVVGNAERLQALVLDLELGLEMPEALGRYQQAALAEARGWGKHGLA